MARRPVKTRRCPLCGEPVKVGALACRSCGSDANTGWSQDADENSVDLGANADEFDYDEFLAKEFPSTRKPAQKASAFARKAALVFVLLSLILALVFWVR
ncbi:MAG: zinc ribbon domain-containing protein [Planctomycetota bacterium]